MINNSYYDLINENMCSCSFISKINSHCEQAIIENLITARSDINDQKSFDKYLLAFHRCHYSWPMYREVNAPVEAFKAVTE